MATKPYPKIVPPPPGPNARAIIARDRAVAAPCYIKEYPLVIARGEGPMVEDVDGNRFLDFMAGIAVSSTGFGHPAVVKAVKEAADRFLHICGSDFYYEGLTALCERLAKLAPGPSPKRVFLTNSGTEAVEGAMKLARYATRRTAFVAFKGAFHGRTYGALSLTSSKAKQHAGFGPFLPDVHHVPYGYCYRCEYGKTFPSCGLFCVSAIERDLFARHLAPRGVAPGLARASPGRRGVGGTGKIFFCERAGVEPDILVAAKGLGSGMPIGAIIAKESVSAWESGSHGTTFGGNPVSCAAALATLDVVQRDLLPHVKARGERLQAGLRALAAKHEVIGDVRGMGLMQGVELVADRTTREPAGELVHRLEGMAFSKGLLTLSAGLNTLRLAPPLVVDDEDVDIALEVLGECLDELD